MKIQLTKNTLTIAFYQQHIKNRIIFIFILKNSLCCFAVVKVMKKKKNKDKINRKELNNEIFLEHLQLKLIK